MIDLGKNISWFKPAMSVRDEVGYSQWWSIHNYWTTIDNGAYLFEKDIKDIIDTKFAKYYEDLWPI